MTSGIWQGRRKEGGSQNEARKAMHRTFSTGEEQRAMGVPDSGWVDGREGGTGWGRVYFLFVLFLLVSKATTTSLPPLASSTVHRPLCSGSPSLTTLLAFLPSKHPPPQHTHNTIPPEAGGRGHRQREKSIACYLGASQVRSGACRSSGLGGHRESLRQRLEGCGV